MERRHPRRLFDSNHEFGKYESKISDTDYGFLKLETIMEPSYHGFEAFPKEYVSG